MISNYPLSRKQRIVLILVRIAGIIAGILVGLYGLLYYLAFVHQYNIHPAIAIFSATVFGIALLKLANTIDKRPLRHLFSDYIDLDTANKKIPPSVPPIAQAKESSINTNEKPPTDLNNPAIRQTEYKDSLP